MKARKFTKRDRRTSGVGIGSLVCSLSFPETEEKYIIRPFGATKTLFERVRKFIHYHLNERNSRLSEARFTIAAEIRAENGGIRQKPLVTWLDGQDIEAALETAEAQWQELDFESDYDSFETEIDL